MLNKILFQRRRGENGRGNEVSKEWVEEAEGERAGEISDVCIM